MRTETTRALLLKRTIMPNDDGVLELFTPLHGRVTAFAKAFGRSKKKAPELDFFRLLSVKLSRGRGSWRLLSVSAEREFSGFMSDFSASEVGYSWLQKLRETVPEDVPCGAFFRSVVNQMAAFSIAQKALCDGYFRVQALAFSGQMPDFSAAKPHDPAALLHVFQHANVREFMALRRSVSLQQWASADFLLTKREQEVV